GVVMKHGCPFATMGSTSDGIANRTKPAPPRSAAVPHKIAAPVMPRLPATTRTRPKSPLLLSGRRGGKIGRLVTISDSRIANASRAITEHCTPSRLDGLRSRLLPTFPLASAFIDCPTWPRKAVVLDPHWMPPTAAIHARRAPASAD